MSDLDFSAAPAIGMGASGLAVWALTNTASLSTTPAVGLAVKVIGSEFYGQPPNAEQKSGELFLGDATHNPLALVAANDDRMNQVVFSNHLLWSAVATPVKTLNSPTKAGIAWFAVAPSVAIGAASGSVAAQGYISVAGENVSYPSIAVNALGKAVATFTLVGPDFFPAAAYTPIDLVTGAAMTIPGPPGPAMSLAGVTTQRPSPMGTASGSRPSLSPIRLPI